MTRIAIIGGGIGGLTTAIALRQFDFAPEVYEQAPVLLDVGAAIAIWPNAMRVLRTLGLESQILDQAGVMEEIRWLTQRGQLINRVRIRDADQDRANPAIALHRADLQRILVQSLPSSSIHLGNVLTTLRSDNDEVISQFANGQTNTSEFVIGCDGIHSIIRSQLLDDAPPSYRGYSVWRGISPITPKAIPPHTAIEIYGRGKRFGLGPVGHGKTGWWATSNTANTSLKAEERSSDRTTWKRGETTSGRSLNTQGELLRLFDGWYRPVLQLIEATSSESVLRTGAFDRRASANIRSERITLLGDSVHPTTPNLGQGGCMAMEDAAIIARCFQKYGASEQALTAYLRVRQRRTNAVTRYSRLYGSIGQWENVLLRGVRRGSLSLVPEPLMRRLMQIVFDYDPNSVSV